MISEEKIFSKSTNQKQELPMAAMFVNGSGRNDASYQVSVHLAKGFQRRRLKCEKCTPSDSKSSRCLWQGELITKFSHRLVLYGSRDCVSF